MKGYRTRQFLRWNELLYGGKFPRDMERVWKDLYIKARKNNWFKKGDNA